MIVASGHQSEAHKVNARPPKQPAAGHCATISECSAFCQVVVPAFAGMTLIFDLYKSLLGQTLSA
jgi:hypothetical protein